MATDSVMGDSGLTEADVPERPTYDAERNADVDDALAEALAVVGEAGEQYLEHLLAAELASWRYTHGSVDVVEPREVEFDEESGAYRLDMECAERNQGAYDGD